MFKFCDVVESNEVCEQPHNPITNIKIKIDSLMKKKICLKNFFIVFFLLLPPICQKGLLTKFVSFLLRLKICILFKSFNKKMLVLIITKIDKITRGSD